MLDNTYQATGYKYGVMVYPDKHTQLYEDILEKTPKTKEESLRVSENNVLNYEALDGLSLKELKSYKELLFKQNYLLFVMYDEITIKELRNDNMYEKPSLETRDIPFIRYIQAIDLKEHKNDEPIDQIIKNQIENNLEQLNPANRRRALGFLEQYIYGSKEETNHKALHVVKL